MNKTKSTQAMLIWRWLGYHNLYGPRSFDVMYICEPNGTDKVTHKSTQKAIE